MPANIEPQDPKKEASTEPPADKASSSSASSPRRIEPNEGEVLPRYLEPGEGSASFKSELYQGLLPHPDHLERFEQLAPGAADRFMEWVEDEARHRREMERREMELHYEYQQQQLLQNGEIQRETMRTELAQTKVETSTQSRVAMGAHFVALMLIASGLTLFILGKEGGAIAFGAVGAIYTSGTIAGIFHRGEGKSTNQKKDSTAIEKIETQPKLKK